MVHKYGRAGAPCTPTCGCGHAGRVTLPIALLCGAVFAGELLPLEDAAVAGRPPQRVERLKATSATRLFLKVKDGAFCDVSTSAAKPVVSGATVFRDETMGDVLRFAPDAQKSGITVPNIPGVTFKDGVTIEALVYLEGPVKKCSFAEKYEKPWTGSPFKLHLERSLTLFSLSFKGEPIDFAEFEGMHKWKLRPDGGYPGEGNRMHGWHSIATGRWTHVAFTYNAKNQHLATWVNRGIDREAFNPWREQFPTLSHQDKAPFRFFTGAAGLRVAEIRVAEKGEEIGFSAPLRIYPTELAYRGYSYIHVEPVTETLPLPVEIVVENQAPGSGAKKVVSYVLNDLKPHNYRIPTAEFLNTTSELVVRLLKDGRELWKYETLLCNPWAGSPMSYRMIRGEPLSGAWPKHSDWWIQEDNTITYKGKPVFPIMTSHVQTNDLDKVFDLGFNMVDVARPPKMGTFDTSWRKVIDDCCAKAAARGKWIQVGSDKPDRPGEGYLYAFDEPHGYSFAPMLATYRALRAARSRSAELPVTGGQNNWQRYRETGMVTDILAVDPYWRGRSPLRSLYDAVKCAIRDTDGLKPITLDVGSYGPRSARPNYDELRTQSYMGVVAGCRSLYYYSWDEGPGQNTAEMPDVCADYKRLFDEFKRFDGALTVPNAEPCPTIAEGPRQGFFACVKNVRVPAKAKRKPAYLFVVSDLYRLSERTLVYPPAAGKKAKLASGSDLPGCSKEIVFDAEGKGKLTLPPLGCGVYEFER